MVNGTLIDSHASNAKRTNRGQFDSIKENESEKVTSESQAVVKVISTRHPRGSFGLPSELRLMIFRDLLITPDGLWGGQLV